MTDSTRLVDRMLPYIFTYFQPWFDNSKKLHSCIQWSTGFGVFWFSLTDRDIIT